jgi:hypothetical protein
VELAVRFEGIGIAQESSSMGICRILKKNKSKYAKCWHFNSYRHRQKKSEYFT